jgi:hypothetical protein
VIFHAHCGFVEHVILLPIAVEPQPYFYSDARAYDALIVHSLHFPAGFHSGTHLYDIIGLLPMLEAKAFSVKSLKSRT